MNIKHQNNISFLCIKITENIRYCFSTYTILYFKRVRIVCNAFHLKTVKNTKVLKSVILESKVTKPKSEFIHII